jgi:hypothetical protein
VTHNVGRHERGLFMGSVIEVFPEQKKKADQGIWYAVLHLFSHDGKYLETQHFRQSTNGRDRMHSQLSEMIRQLSAVSFEDISIAPFDTKIDGTIFGLVDVSDASQGIWRVELRPLGITFPRH